MPHPRWRSAVVAASALSLAVAPFAALAEPTAATTHVVQPGETLWDIASSVGLDAATLVRLNGLDDGDVLSVGQTLSLPGNVAPPAPNAAAPAAAGPAGVVAGRSYIVAVGDTLWAIAQQLGTTPDALAQANHLDDPDHLALGTRLVVPGPASANAAAAAPHAPATTAATPTPLPGPASSSRPSPAPSSAIAGRSLLVSYTVQPGETLSQIARQFDVRPDAVAQASALEDADRLSVGLVLRVPVPGKEHQVSAGETLRDIAAQEKVDLGSLLDFNQLDDPDLIHVGQVVLVPVPANAPPAEAGPAAAQAATATPRPKPSPAPPTPAPTPPTPAAGQVAAGKAAAPLAVVSPPRAAPSDGLAGAALKFLGAPYVWGGSSPSGFDCSGLVWYVSRQVGKPLSRAMLGEYNGGSHPARDELKPGDLVFFQNTYAPGLSHNGIYIGNGQFVHAADEQAGVTISSLATPYWSAHWFGATRLP